MYNVLSVAPLVSNKLRPIICFSVFFVIYCKTSNLQLFFSEVNSSYDLYMYMAGRNVFLHFFFFFAFTVGGTCRRNSLKISVHCIYQSFCSWENLHWFLYSWVHSFPVNIFPTDLLFSLCRRDCTSLCKWYEYKYVLTSLVALSTRSGSEVMWASLIRLSGRLSIMLSSSAEYRSSE